MNFFIPRSLCKWISKASAFPTIYKYLGIYLQKKEPLTEPNVDCFAPQIQGAIRLKKGVTMPDENTVPAGQTQNAKNEERKTARAADTLTSIASNTPAPKPLEKNVTTQAGGEANKKSW